MLFKFMKKKLTKKYITKSNHTHVYNDQNKEFSIVN